MTMCYLRLNSSELIAERRSNLIMVFMSNIKILVLDVLCKLWWALLECSWSILLFDGINVTWKIFISCNLHLIYGLVLKLFAGLNVRLHSSRKIDLSHVCFGPQAPRYEEDLNNGTTIQEWFSFFDSYWRIFIVANVGQLGTGSLSSQHLLCWMQ